MADDRPDDQDQPRGGATPGDGSGRRPAPDETAARPAPDETAPHRAVDGDETARHPGVGGDETAPHPAFDADQTAAYPPYRPGAGEAPTDPDGTRVVAPGGDERETAAMPPVGGNWAARAPVPPRAAEPMIERRQWTEQAPRPPERRWWIPALIALVVLLLLAVLGFGLWLLFGGDGEGGSPVPPAPSVSATGPPAPQTTQPPPTAPTASTATSDAGVVVPRLIGLSEGDARATLDDVGLGYRLAFQENGGFPPGSVIGSDPPAGTVMPRDGQVTLIIATAPPPTEPAPATTPPPTPTTAGPTN